MAELFNSKIRGNFHIFFSKEHKFFLQNTENIVKLHFKKISILLDIHILTEKSVLLCNYMYVRNKFQRCSSKFAAVNFCQIIEEWPWINLHVYLLYLKVPDMIHTIIPPIYFQTYADFGTKSLIIFFWLLWWSLVWISQIPQEKSMEMLLQN